jgi:hypothetical protein
MNMRNMLAGWDYFFRPTPEANAQATANRAGFALYQEYPQNTVQGHGTLTMHNAPNVITQPPQIFVNHEATIESIYGTGMEAGTFYGQELVPNPDSTGIT